jgi:ribosomal protein S18 acetylase RimI-like enzyme
MLDQFTIRTLKERDIPKLIDIRPGFRTDHILRLHRQGQGYEVSWKLVEVALSQVYDKGRGYDFDATERANIRARFLEGNGLWEVVETLEDKRIVGILDVELREWNNTAWIWNIMLDDSVRRHGLGSVLIQRTIDWARQNQVRAIMLETQTNNLPACRFYQKLGFELIGINEVFYTNQDTERDEIALFWAYRLE